MVDHSPAACLYVAAVNAPRRFSYDHLFSHAAVGSVSRFTDTPAQDSHHLPTAAFRSAFFYMPAALFGDLAAALSRQPMYGIVGRIPTSIKKFI